MIEFTMKCPGNCGKHYRITINDKDLNTSVWVCPNCNFRASFNVITKNNIRNVGPDVPMGSTVQEMPPIPPNVKTPSGEKTQVYNPSTSSSKTLVAAKNMFLQVANGGPRIPVKLVAGRYIMGRKSSDSTAQIKLMPDMSVSREHAVLIIQQKENDFIVGIQPNKSNNPVFVNNKAIPYGKIAILNNGDVIRMGNTLMQVVK